MKTWLAYLALAAGGGLLIGALLVLGVDVVRLSREGPRWRRRMMGAGLVLLAAGLLFGAAVLMKQQAALIALWASLADCPAPSCAFHGGLAL